MKYFSLVYFFLFSFLFKANAQTIEGTAHSFRTYAPLSFVTISMHNKNIGVSDEKGKFKIPIQDIKPTDSIFFSCLGYLSKAVSGDLLINSKDKKKLDIVLLPTSYEVKEVEIRANQTKVETIGNKSKSKYVLAGFRELRSELGTILKTKDNFKMKVETFNFNIAHNPHDSITFKLNIYNVIDNKIQSSPHWSEDIQ